MKIRTIVGLGLVGTAIYAHKKRGGDMSIESMKSSARALWQGIQNKATDVKERAQEFGEEAQERARELSREGQREPREVIVEAQDVSEETGVGPYHPGTLGR